MRKIKRKHVIPGLFIGIMMLSLFAVWRHQARPPRPNVILIVLDTVRADHIGFFGGNPKVTPNIDSFIKNSAAFENAYAPERNTPVSHMTMFTGLYPATHKVDARNRGLDRKIPTLAEILKKEGYLTLGYTGAAGLLSPKFGFGKGFDFYNNGKYGVKKHKVSAELETTAILHQLNSIKKRRPLFLFINYFDAHHDSGKLPYNSPIEYRQLFCSEQERNFTGKVGPNYWGDVSRANEPPTKVPKEYIEQIICFYDAGLAYLDHWVGILIQNLKEMNLYDNSLIILTSDHGEEFREHGYFRHRNSFLHEGLVNVPLAIKLPGARDPHVFSTPVGLVDLLPTIMDYLKIGKKSLLQGESLLSLIQSKTEEDRIAYGMGIRGLAFVRKENWKLIVQKFDSSNPKYQLFNLSTDPGEMKDLTLVNPAKFSELKLTLKNKYEKAQSVKFNNPSQTLTPDELEGLKSLGYLN